MVIPYSLIIVDAHSILKDDLSVCVFMHGEDRSVCVYVCVCVCVFVEERERERVRES